MAEPTTSEKRYTFTASVPGTYCIGYGQPHLVSQCTDLCRAGAVWNAPAAWLELDRPARERAHRTAAWIRDCIVQARSQAQAATPGPWESDGDDLYSVHDAERGDRLGDLVAYMRAADTAENSANCEHVVRYDPSRVMTILAVAEDLLTDLERIETRAPHPDPRQWAREAIGSLAGIWGAPPPAGR